MSQISSEETNYLIYRYFQEAGFVHSAFTFSQESFIHKVDIKHTAVPPGMLITLLQKGLQFASIEFHLNDDGSEKECSKPFSLLDPHICEKPSPQPLPSALHQNNLSSSSSYQNNSTIIVGTTKASAKREGNPGKKEKEDKRDIATNGGEKGGGKKRKKEKITSPTSAIITSNATTAPTTTAATTTTTGSNFDKNIDVVGGEGGSQSNGRPILRPIAATNSVVANTPSSLPSIFPTSSIHILRGHGSEVISCAWNPKGSPLSMLASASGDATARIWRIPNIDEEWDANVVENFEIDSQEGHPKNQTLSVILKHSTVDKDKSISLSSNEEEANINRDVTALDWSPDGNILATGCYDGQARLWSLKGELLGLVNKHRGPIFSLRWSPDGRYIASAGLDQTAIVWDVQGGKLWRCYDGDATAPTLDIDWKDDQCFATCSTDKHVYVYDLNLDRPIKIFYGHEDEVNSIRWSPDGKRLASCSDDRTAKIWNLDGEDPTGHLLHNLSEHLMEIYTVKWNNTGPGSPNPTKASLLATASFDQTVRLWDPKDGRCLHVLKKHTQPVYAIAFSPDGEYLASGSLDETLTVWSVSDGIPIQTFNTGRGGIFEVGWSPDGQRLIACTSDSTVYVLDFRRKDAF